MGRRRREEKAGRSGCPHHVHKGPTFLFFRIRLHGNSGRLDDVQGARTCLFHYHALGLVLDVVDDDDDGGIWW